MNKFIFQARCLMDEQWRRYRNSSVGFILFLVVIGTALDQLFCIYTLLESQYPPSVPLSKAAAKHTNNHKQQIITEWHLFGQKENHNANTSNIKWLLRGVITAKDLKNNLAIIASSNTNEAVYKNGDSLADGTIVDAIFSDHVVLLRNGVAETIVIWEK